jgi:hypothetical protein
MPEYILDFRPADQKRGFKVGWTVDDVESIRAEVHAVLDQTIDYYANQKEEEA